MTKVPSKSLNSAVLSVLKTEGRPLRGDEMAAIINGQGIFRVTKELANVCLFGLEKTGKVCKDSLNRWSIQRNGDAAPREEAPSDRLPQTGRQQAHRSGGPVSRGELRFICESDESKRLLGLCKRVAPVDLPVLISGEVGTGKDLLARMIHHLSGRTGPFHKIDLGALSPDTAADRLFGHEKGAFTGAVESIPGLLRQAAGGTVCFDRIERAPNDIQRQLLPFLDRKEITPLGSNTAVPVDARVIASTCGDHAALPGEGKLREDLFLRISGIQIRVPPLRERREDIRPLVRHFISLANAEFQRDIEGISPEALASLVKYPWPGNVRELQNCIEAAVVTSGDRILRPSNFPRQATQQTTAPLPELNTEKRSLKEIVNGVEQQVVIDALTKSGGVQVRAAEILGITERSLWHLVKKHSIDVGCFKSSD